MRTLQRLLLVLLVAFALAAPAVRQGDPLYIRSRDTKLLSTPDVKGKAVALLQPGTQVVWRGAAKENRLLHQVEVSVNGAASTGYVLQANLSPQKPKEEYLGRDDGKAIDPQAFKSSGAATRAVDEVAVKWALEKNVPDLPQRLAALEQINAGFDRRAMWERNRSAGLAAVEAEAPAKKPGRKGKK